MAVRVIPPKTKQSVILFWGLTIKDVLIFLVFIGLAIMIFNLNLEFNIRLTLMVVVIMTGVLLVSKLTEVRTYMFLFNGLKFLVRNKKMEAFDFGKVTGLKFNKDYVSVGSNKSVIIEVNGIDFRILTEEKQDRKIKQLTNVFQSIKRGKIVKLEKPISYKDQIADIERRKKFFEGKKGYEGQMEILENQGWQLEYLDNEKVFKAEAFYFIIYGLNADEIKDKAESVIEQLDNIGLEAKKLEYNELKQFYELYYDVVMNEDDSFVMPDIKEYINKLSIGGESIRVAAIKDLPLFCANGWLSELFSIQGTKAVMSFKTNDNKAKIRKTIDRTIVELQSRYIAKGTSPSMQQELDSHIGALRDLLYQIQLDNETVHVVQFFIFYPENMHKKVVEVFKENNIFITQLFFKQLTSYLTCSPYLHETEEIVEATKDIQSSSLAASFPFVTQKFIDKNGTYMGYNTSTIFFNIFAAWERIGGPRRTNSNMVIIGKSGAGKSFYSKMMLMNQALDGTKVFILDPEDEYKHLCKSLNGSFIDVGGVASGIINPLQIFPSFKADEDEEDLFDTLSHVSSHRQFLQEFFKSVLPNLNEHSAIFLNQAIKTMYDNFGIVDEGTKEAYELKAKGKKIKRIESYRAEEFPIMDDLYKVVVDRLEEEVKANHEYEAQYIRILKNSLEDFKEGGLHAKLWNGYTTLEMKSMFTVLNFQSLFSTNNNLIANGQMLLLMRFLMQEVINNKNRNDITGDNIKIMIQVDEAHQFIDPQFPVALTFMKDMAKRIRKYGGSLVVATQNIADFIGHNETTRTLATAVINGCQYQTIFGLAPDDLNSVTNLYRGYAGGLTDRELDFVANAERGQMLLMVDSETRLVCQVALYDGEQKYIEKI